MSWQTTKAFRDFAMDRSVEENIHVESVAEVTPTERQSLVLVSWRHNPFLDLIVDRKLRATKLRELLFHEDHIARIE